MVWLKPLDARLSATSPGTRQSEEADSSPERPRPWRERYMETVAFAAALAVALVQVTCGQLQCGVERDQEESAPDGSCRDALKSSRRSCGVSAADDDDAAEDGDVEAAISSETRRKRGRQVVAAAMDDGSELVSGDVECASELPSTVLCARPKATGTQSSLAHHSLSLNKMKTNHSPLLTIGSSNPRQQDQHVWSLHE